MMPKLLDGKCDAKTDAGFELCQKLRFFEVEASEYQTEHEVPPQIFE